MRNLILLTGLLSILATAFCAMSVVSIRSDSIEASMADFRTYNTILTWLVPAGTIFLLIGANRVYLKQGFGSAFLLPLGFFWIFTMIDYWPIQDRYFHFIKETGQWKGGFSILSIAGIVFCLIAGGVILSNYLILYTKKKYHR